MLRYNHLLVEHGLSTDTWGEAFAVLDTAEARSRDITATEELAERVKRGDPVATQHQRILDAAQYMDRSTLCALVTNPDQALESAV